MAASREKKIDNTLSFFGTFGYTQAIVNIRKLAICHVSPSFFIKIYLEHLCIIITKIFTYIFQKIKNHNHWSPLICLQGKCNSRKGIPMSCACIYYFVCHSVLITAIFSSYCYCHNTKRDWGNWWKAKWVSKFTTIFHCNHDFLKPCMNHNNDMSAGPLVSSLWVSSQTVSSWDLSVYSLIIILVFVSFSLFNITANNQPRNLPWNHASSTWQFLPDWRFTHASSPTFHLYYLGHSCSLYSPGLLLQKRCWAG